MYNKERNQKGPQILIVDDHLETLNLLQLHLSAHHYNVEIAVNGYDALEKLSHNQFDLIITDISMPGMGGNELCHTIRESCDESRLPIIAITAEPWLATADFSHVVNKPFRIAALSKTIHDTLTSSGKVVSLEGRKK